jgi:TonB family protein
LSGVTLTAGDGGSWSSPTGNGEIMAGPIHRSVPAPTNTKEGVERAKSAVGTLSTFEPVRLSELAEKPIPPVLDTKLRANYPASAKRQGLSGTAKVRARVDADGIVRQASMLFESGEGFGAACRQTLIGSHWSTPRDRAGMPVATQVHYTCQFRVDGS